MSTVILMYFRFIIIWHKKLNNFGHVSRKEVIFKVHYRKEG